MNLTWCANERYPDSVAKKEATGFGDSNVYGGRPPPGGFFLSVHPRFNERQWWGYLRVCRFPYAPVRQPRHDRTLEAGETLDAARLMRDLNRKHDLVAGMGVALRIVAGNSVLKGNFSADDPACPVPLTSYAEGVLTTMAATICEDIRDDIEERARLYNDQADRLTRPSRGSN